MKASITQKLLISVIVSRLLSCNDLFVPMPAKSTEHYAELKKQARAIMIDLAKADGEDAADMEARMVKDFGANWRDDVPASKPDPKSAEKEVTFYGESASVLVGALGDIRNKLSDILKNKPKHIPEVRGIVRLGYEDGVYAFVVFTNDKSVFDSAESGEYIGQAECDNPDCSTCNPSDQDASETIQ